MTSDRAVSSLMFPRASYISCIQMPHHLSSEKIDFQTLFESVPALCLVLDPHLIITAVSDAYLHATMTKRAEILGRGIFDVFPDNPNDEGATGANNLRLSLERVLHYKKPHTMAVQKYDIRRPESEGGGFEERYWSPINTPVLSHDNHVLYIIHKVEDVTDFIHLKQKEATQHETIHNLQTSIGSADVEVYKRAQEIQELNRGMEAERKTLEQKLWQVQKMESIGNLTGGMAHDFNNLLGIIIGNLDLLGEHLTDSQSKQFNAQALGAALRGSDLTRRLLAFARQQPLQPRLIDVNKLISELISLLSRTLGEDIQITLHLANVWPIVADPAQLEASITNLANNGRDAMPKGGVLHITTNNRHLDDDYASLHPGATPGEYVVIEISDTGTGIPPQNIDRIFDPFFTTKERGKGTGLGLSMVFGFIKQSNGHINVYSEVGVGTTFRLYLPRATENAPLAEMPSSTPQTYIGGNERILVVEDNPAMRSVVVRQLVELGYFVLAAANAKAALDILKAEKIDLLLSDVIMPGGMDGYELVKTAINQYPSLKVILTSGFPETRLSGEDDFIKCVRLLSKPYRKADLAHVIREAFDKKD